MNKMKLAPLTLVAMLMMSGASADTHQLSDVVIVASPMSDPSVVEMDPKQPRQPLPAHDGADLLKSVSGFSVMRKAGSDGEPNFRGMGGSRVNILADDQNIFGGCGQRMDAPTAYIFPEIYDKVTIIKGPQTVLYPGQGSAATVRFEKEQKTYQQPGYDVHASGLYGSFGRHDEVVDSNVGGKGVYANFTGSNSYSDDYKDGSGNSVRSKYHRYSASTTIGLSPDDNKKFEFSAGTSNGYAYYADRTMDGTKFLRENYGFKSQIKDISYFVESLDFQLARNKIFHTMSEIPRGGSNYMDVRNDLYSARILSNLNLRTTTKAKIGFDWSESTHSGNMPTMGMPNFSDDLIYRQTSFFAELTEILQGGQRIIGGYRGGYFDAKDMRSSGSSDTSGQSRTEFTHSGFIRFENQMSAIPNSKGYVGFGRSERFPDYWELISARRDGAVGACMGMMCSSNLHSSFQSTKTEKTYQLDIGIIHKSPKLDSSVSAFYNKIYDFVLIDGRSGYTSGSYATPTARNVDAYTFGAEFDATYKLSNSVRTSTGMSYVYGRNQTDSLPLAQLAPFEGRIAVAYDDKTYTAGMLLRLVASKTQFSLNQGNIAGKDIGASSGFAIFSVNAGYKPQKRVKFALGVDNLFNKNYAEFISRTGSGDSTLAGLGYAQTTRVNEPGRFAWLKATIALD